MCYYGNVTTTTRWRMCYYGNVTTTRWRICVTMATLRQQQDGGYVLPWQRYDNKKMVAMRYHENDDVILHLQQYSHRLNLLCLVFFSSQYRMDFTETACVCVCALLLPRRKDGRKKRYWVLPVDSKRLLNGHFYKVYSSANDSRHSVTSICTCISFLNRILIR